MAKNKRKWTPEEEQKFEQVKITDDLMFCTVFQNEEDCRKLLERILQIHIIEIEVVQEQKNMKGSIQSKGSRLDIYVRDDQMNSYDIEMQLVNSEELILRSRYYHSEMDMYQIKQGQDYTDLKQSIVIFICNFDPFKDGKSIYTFEATCRENKDIILADKRKTIFANLRGDREGIEQDTVNLLDYFRTGEPTDEFTRGLQGKVEQLRNDDEWRENRMTIEMREKLIYRQGKKEGIAEGIEQGIEQGIKSLIATCQKYQVPYENTKADLMEQYGLQEEKADEYMQKYFAKIS